MQPSTRWTTLMLLTSLPFTTLPARAQVSPGPLARAHRELEGTLNCTRCHTGGRESANSRCTACHRDIAWLADRGRGVHGDRNVISRTCASCHPDHAGVDFALIKWPEGTPERFDHRRAGWPLEQSHARLRCAECHDAKFRVSPAAALRAEPAAAGWTGLEPSCASCHEDVHRGALGADCTTCHNAGKWAVTPGFSHDTTGYRLEGVHARTSCDKCHLAARLSPRRDPQGQLIPVYRPVPHGACTDCHADVHKGQFGATCTQCHSPAGWKQIDRSRFDHSRTRYPLAGRHAAVPCASCHKDFSTEALKKPAFRTCGTCHADAHKGTATLAGQAVDCAECHDVAGFTPSTYTVARHATTKYPLGGKHRTVRCADCHTRDGTAQGLARWGTSRVVLRPGYAACTSCHADDHGGQLARRAGGGACDGCHTPEGWTPSRFTVADHAALRLPLEGRHAEVSCRACHGSDRKGLPPMATTAALGKARFLFKVSETTCAACHLDPHQGRFAPGGAHPVPEGCAACHGTASFRPATTGIATHRGFGFSLDGAHGATPCVACHEEMKRPPGPRASSLLQGGARFPKLTFEAPQACDRCHQNPHGDQFGSRGCETCHSVAAFQPADRFDHDRDASFKLTGAHERVACDRCHTRAAGDTSPRRYRPLSGKCESCHGKGGT